MAAARSQRYYASMVMHLRYYGIFNTGKSTNFKTTFTETGSFPSIGRKKK